MENVLDLVTLIFDIFDLDLQIWPTYPSGPYVCPFGRESCNRYYASFYVTEESAHDRPLHKENNEGMNINL